MPLESLLSGSWLRQRLKHFAIFRGRRQFIPLGCFYYIKFESRNRLGFSVARERQGETRMGALAPIAGLLSSAGLGGLGGSGGLSQTPPLDNFFGIDGRFLKAPAGGTALVNNLLFGSSNQQVPIDFLAQGFYTGVPPIFGGTGFQGLPARFNLFAGPQGPVGVDAVLGLERAVRGGGSAVGGTSFSNPLGGLGSNPLAGLLLSSLLGGGVAGAADNKGTAASAIPATTGNNATLSRDSLSKMSLGSLIKLLG
jgi:hypothetical protein